MSKSACPCLRRVLASSRRLASRSRSRRPESSETMRQLGGKADQIFTASGQAMKPPSSAVTTRPSIRTPCDPYVTAANRRGSDKPRELSSRARSYRGHHPSGDGRPSAGACDRACRTNTVAAPANRRRVPSTVTLIGLTACPPGWRTWALRDVGESITTRQAQLRA